MNKTEAVAAISAEYDRATGLHGPFKSAHEGYSVMLEELDELWEEIKRGGPDSGEKDHDKMKKEAIQLGAMALRFLHDICD